MARERYGKVNKALTLMRSTAKADCYEHLQMRSTQKERDLGERTNEQDGGGGRHGARYATNITLLL